MDKDSYLRGRRSRDFVNVYSASSCGKDPRCKSFVYNDEAKDQGFLIAKDCPDGSGKDW